MYDGAGVVPAMYSSSIVAELASGQISSGEYADRPYAAGAGIGQPGLATSSSQNFAPYPGLQRYGASSNLATRLPFGFSLYSPPPGDVAPAFGNQLYVPPRLDLERPPIDYHRPPGQVQKQLAPRTSLDVPSASPSGAPPDSPDGSAGSRSKVPGRHASRESGNPSAREARKERPWRALAAKGQDERKIQRVFEMDEPADQIRREGRSEKRKGSKNPTAVISIPELDLVVPMPEWFKEAEAELDKELPAWPPAKGKRVGIIEATQDVEIVVKDADHDPDKIAKEAKEKSAGRKLVGLLYCVIIALHLERSGLKTLVNWAEQMRAQFADAYDMHMRACVSWLTRACRVFIRTLIADSHRGLVLAASGVKKYAMQHRAGHGLPSVRCLSIRTGVLLDLIYQEDPPDSLAGFLGRLAMSGGAILHLPEWYLTPGEAKQLRQDQRGGVTAESKSYEHKVLVVGFVLVRGLLGNVFRSLIESLSLESGARSELAKNNLEAIALLVMAAIRSLYGEIVGCTDEVPGLALALGHAGKDSKRGHLGKTHPAPSSELSALLSDFLGTNSDDEEPRGILPHFYSTGKRQEDDVFDPVPVAEEQVDMFIDALVERAEAHCPRQTAPRAHEGAAGVSVHRAGTESSFESDAVSGVESSER